MEYKYTYQDWLNGNTQGDYEDEIRKAFHLQYLLKIEQQIKDAAIKK